MAKTTLREFSSNIVINRDGPSSLPTFVGLGIGEMFRYVEGGHDNVYMKATASQAVYLRTGSLFNIGDLVKVILVNEITIKAS